MEVTSANNDAVSPASHDDAIDLNSISQSESIGGALCT
jgi:hypothetical protein